MRAHDLVAGGFQRRIVALVTGALLAGFGFGVWIETTAVFGATASAIGAAILKLWRWI